MFLESDYIIYATPVVVTVPPVVVINSGDHNLHLFSRVILQTNYDLTIT